MPAVLVTVRALSRGGDPARTAAPFVVLAPTALWVATSADALFAGVAAWGVALLASAADRAPGPRRRPPCRRPGGCSCGLALYLSFGLTSLGLVVLAVVGVQRGGSGPRAWCRVLGVAAAGVLVAVAAVFAVGGYWWVEGLSAAGDRVRSGPSYADRPLSFFLVAEPRRGGDRPGPAAFAGLGALRRSRLGAAAAGGPGRDAGQRRLRPGPRGDRADLAAVLRLGARPPRPSCRVRQRRCVAAAVGRSRRS